MKRSTKLGLALATAFALPTAISAQAANHVSWGLGGHGIHHSNPFLAGAGGGNAFFVDADPWALAVSVGAGCGGRAYDAWGRGCDAWGRGCDHWDYGCDHWSHGCDHWAAAAITGAMVAAMATTTVSSDVPARMPATSRDMRPWAGSGGAGRRSSRWDGRLGAIAFSHRSSTAPSGAGADGSSIRSGATTGVPCGSATPVPISRVAATWSRNTDTETLNTEAGTTGPSVARRFSDRATRRIRAST